MLKQTTSTKKNSHALIKRGNYATDTKGSLYALSLVGLGEALASTLSCLLAGAVR
jgi:hypothetical protein